MAGGGSPLTPNMAGRARRAGGRAGGDGAHAEIRRRRGEAARLALNSRRVAQCRRGRSVSSFRLSPLHRSRLFTAVTLHRCDLPPL
eukprot:284524-Prymnesium_polylepis.1